MKTSRVVLVAIAVLLSTESYSQKVSLAVKNAPLETVFNLIEKQTTYKFVYTDEAMALSAPVSIDVKNEMLNKVLKLCFSNQPFTYSVEYNLIIVKKGPKIKERVVAPVDVHGTVSSQTNEPLPSASIRIKETGVGTITDEKGNFALQNVRSNSTLIVTNIGYETIEIPLDGKVDMNITLKPTVNKLDEALVIGYGKTTQRYNTGSVFKVSSQVIGEQPVANPLAALEGRVPGMTITQSNGLPGSYFKVQIRGQNSIAQGSDPLFIIDGVPFAPNNTPVNNINSAAGANGLSPFNSINPDDIESMEILKDADATAIYGSRGANGVVLVTTKKGKAGKTQFKLNIYSGISRVTRTPDMLNTQQYLQMRREAFKNDGIEPDINSAPDLLVYDSTRYTNFSHLLIGSAAHTTNVQASVTGGDANTQFLIGGSLHHETTVFPGDLADDRSAVNANISHSSNDHHFNLTLASIYSYDDNKINVSDLTSFIMLPPNLPSLYDSAGKLNWQYKGVAFDNPLAYLLEKYTAETYNLISNLTVAYNVFTGLTIKTSAGYNSFDVKEVNTNPIASQNPVYNPEGYSQFGSNSIKSWIIEPQIIYTHAIHKLQIDALVGSTFQQQVSDNTSFFAYGYTNDALLKSINAASSISVLNDNHNEYRYNALFGRVTFNWQSKYLLNFSGRRDGSSRFGPGNQFANFGAVGGAWIFSNERIIKTSLPFLSFGKMRGSYGITGNDQIGNYQYLDSWRPVNYPYQGVTGLQPTQLFNPSYSWEINRKTEAAVDLGFFKDAVVVDVDYFRNRSSNQLIQYALPTQTGFTSIISNFPALIQNTGVEISVTTKNITTKSFTWGSALNITTPKNKLVSFAGLATSSYANRYVIGQSLNVLRGLHSNGVDATTGVFSFEDLNKDGILDTKDYTSFGNLDPKVYGGLSNTFSFKGITADIFFEFKQQKGKNYLSTIYSSYGYPPGTMGNQPVPVLSRWQQAGNNTGIQQYSATYGTAAYNALNYVYQSNAVYSKASYIRLKNIAVSYNVASKWLSKKHVAGFRIYMQCQNVFTVTGYKVADPETQNLYTLPPLKTFTAGIQCTF